MLLNSNTTIVVGPPGTGKTRTLIDMVVEAVRSGCPPDYICYMSFTRQAVKQAKNRIVKELPDVDKDKFAGFRTLHSLCYWLVGAKPSDILEAPPNLSDRLQEVVDHYDYLYSYSRMSGKDLKWVWEHKAKRTIGNEIDFLRWVQEYGAYKAQTQKIDFMDLVDGFISKEVVFPFTYLFIDEAQDLTPQQWGAINQLAKYAQNVVVAGDVDQTIFAWAGATSDILDELEGEKIFLTQSHRVPSKVHCVAKTILGEMGKEIIYRPTEEAGNIYWLRPEEVIQLPLCNGESWYLLARNRCFLDILEGSLKWHRLPYHRLGAVAGLDSLFEKYVRKIKQYQKLQDGETVHQATYRRLEELSTNLKRHLKIGSDWATAFDKVPMNHKKYIIEAMTKVDTSDIHVGTFHSSKGGEADNVVLMGDATDVCLQNLRVGKVEELRALYVALTRTKKNLYICSPVRMRGIPWSSILQQSQGHINGLLSNALIPLRT